MEIVLKNRKSRFGEIFTSVDLDNIQDILEAYKNNLLGAIISNLLEQS